MRAREILRSTRRVLDGLATFGWTTSPMVVTKSGNLLRRNSRWKQPLMRSAIVYPTVSEDGSTIYLPTIGFDKHGHINLELTHCTCEAGHAGILCHHLLGALINADHLGYRLES